MSFCTLSIFCVNPSFYVIPSFCMIPSFCVTSFLLCFFFILRILYSKYSCPTGPQHSLVAHLEPLRHVPILPHCNELLHHSLSCFHLCENGGLFDGDLLDGLLGQIMQFILCISHDLLDLLLDSGQVSNNLDRFLLPRSKSLFEGPSVGPSVALLQHMLVTVPKWPPFARPMAMCCLFYRRCSQFGLYNLHF
jgi:hypothetical protein